MKQPEIQMVQVMPHKWEVRSQKGHVLQQDITISSIAEALEFIRKYASSFNGWTFEVVPFKK